MGRIVTAMLACLLVAACAEQRPVVYVGYGTGTNFVRGHETNLSGPILEVQSSATKLATFLKASTAGTGAVGVQYGITPYQRGPWSVTITPQFGAGYIDRTVYEETSQLNFNLGLNTAVGYGRSRVAAGWWHQSNAGLGGQNTGLDILQLMGGWVF